MLTFIAIVLIYGTMSMLTGYFAGRCNCRFEEETLPICVIFSPIGMWFMLALLMREIGDTHLERSNEDREFQKKLREAKHALDLAAIADQTNEVRRIK